MMAPLNETPTTCPVIRATYDTEADQFLRFLEKVIPTASGHSNTISSNICNEGHDRQSGDGSPTGS